MPTNIDYLLSETISYFNEYQVIAVIDKPQVRGNSRMDITSVVENENNTAVTVQKFFMFIAADTPLRGYHVVKNTSIDQACCFLLFWSQIKDVFSL